MQIEVTTSHISQGVKYSPCGCPVALAVYDAVHSYATVTTNVRVKDLSLIGELAGEAKQFIRDFDDDRAVSPFSFDLALSSYNLA